MDCHCTETPSVPARTAEESLALFVDSLGPLYALAKDVRATGAPSLAWSTAHVRDGDLRGVVTAMWDACNDPGTLLDLVEACAGKGRRTELYDWYKETIAAYLPWAGSMDEMTPSAEEFWQREARHAHLGMLAMRAAVPVAPRLPCEDRALDARDLGP